jgi:hypothetical protein
MIANESNLAEVVISFTAGSKLYGMASRTVGDNKKPRRPFETAGFLFKFDST